MHCLLLQYALYNVKLQLELINANVANLNHIRLKRKFKQKYSKQTHDTDNYIQSIYNQR